MSFILQSTTGRQGVAYRHEYCWFYLGRFRRSSHTNRRNLPSSTTPLSFDAPAQGNPREYPHKAYISRNWIHWPTFLSLTVCVYLHSHLCSVHDSYLSNDATITSAPPIIWTNFILFYVKNYKPSPSLANSRVERSRPMAKFVKSYADKTIDSFWTRCIKHRVDAGIVSYKKELWERRRREDWGAVGRGHRPPPWLIIGISEYFPEKYNDRGCYHATVSAIFRGYVTIGRNSQKAGVCDYINNIVLSSIQRAPLNSSIDV